jgi:F0F1-type ATP synthase membrane subunit b/b'
MKAAWTWVRKWSGLILGGVLVVFGAGWLWRRERAKRLSAEAQAEVNALREEIAGAKVVRQNFIDDAEDHTRAIDVLDRRIEERERAILNAHDEPLEGLSRDEIRQRLRALGF